ncbi:MAG: DNA repair protein RecO [Bacteroidales bacterium]|jgi:DNA repair protein RecO (recombination protein O)|nr:DNA repair protein RecO [Bacteroidales bacterium]
MIEKTSAIVIKTYPYKETSSIVSLYSERFGLKTYIIKGGRKKNAPIPSNVFQPLQILDIIVYNKPKIVLNQIKEYALTYNLQNIYCNIIKTTLAIFITEIISLSLKEENPNDEAYIFLKDTITTLNDIDDKYLKDFHLFFMINFASLLGFQPMNNFDEENKFFDITKGCFSNNISTNSLSFDLSSTLHKFLIQSPNITPITQSSIERNNILNALILFYQEHITNNKPIKSQQILSSIL